MKNTYTPYYIPCFDLGATITGSLFPLYTPCLNFTYHLVYIDLRRPHRPTNRTR